MNGPVIIMHLKFSGATLLLPSINVLCVGCHTCHAELFLADLEVQARIGH